jgi:uncharacterized membrane protein
VIVSDLLRNGLIKDVKLEGNKIKLDTFGVVLSVVGLATMVQGILMASTYGLFRARQSFSLFGIVNFEAGGISPSIVGIAIGILVLMVFAGWEAYRLKKGKDQLVNLKLLKLPAVGGGTLTILAQQFVLGGLMYVMALYLQIQQLSPHLKLVTLLPLSLCLLAARVAINC